MSHRSLIVFAALVLGLPAAAPGAGRDPAPVVREFDAAQIRQFPLSPEVVADPKDGTLRLAHSVLLADEMGATDFHQTEELSERVQVKKVFVLDSTDLAQSELFFFGSAKQVSVNGEVLPSPQRL